MATNEEIITMCATTQADVRNICNTLDGMKVFMGKQIDQHSDTIARLAVIERVQNDMKSDMTTYTTDCTKDRNTQDNRLKDVENFQNNQMKVAGAIGGVCAFLVAGGIKILDKIFS